MAGILLAAALTSNPSAQVAGVSADGHGTAALQIEGSSAQLSVRVASLGGTGGTLVRASTSAGAPLRPQLGISTAGGKNRSGQLAVLSLVPGAGHGRGTSPVTVTLNSAVTWVLDFAAGSQRTVADLSGAHIAGLGFTAGTATIDVTLPRPRGTVPVVLAGGAGLLRLRLPSAAAVRVTAKDGAGAISLYGVTKAGAGAGTVLDSPGWATATARYDVDATSGAATVSVIR